MLLFICHKYTKKGLNYQAFLSFFNYLQQAVSALQVESVSHLIESTEQVVESHFFTSHFSLEEQDDTNVTNVKIYNNCFIILN